uniref:Uncharacterized protein n=1 Tax=Anopheles darlingi TaxID=43151 RepID=A0A2M4DMR4_ANODA
MFACSFCSTLTLLNLFVGEFLTLSTVACAKARFVVGLLGPCFASVSNESRRVFRFGLCTISICFSTKGTGLFVISSSEVFSVTVGFTGISSFSVFFVSSVSIGSSRGKA